MCLVCGVCGVVCGVLVCWCVVVCRVLCMLCVVCCVLLLLFVWAVQNENHCYRSLENKATHGYGPILSVSSLKRFSWTIEKTHSKLQSLPCTGQVRSGQVRSGDVVSIVMPSLAQKSPAEPRRPQESLGEPKRATVHGADGNGSMVTRK